MKKVKMYEDEVISFYDKGNDELKKYFLLSQKTDFSLETNKKEKIEALRVLKSASENFFKYIISIHQYKDYNEKIEGYMYDEGTLEFLIKHNIAESSLEVSLEKYISVDEDGYKKYYYMYLYHLINSLFSNDIKNIELIAKNLVSVNISEKKCNVKKLSNKIKFMLITNSFNYDLLHEKEKENLKDIISEFNKKIDEVNEDILLSIKTVMDKKNDIVEYDINIIYRLVLVLRLYCTILSENDNDYTLNIEQLMYWKNVENYSSIINRTKDDIKIIQSASKFRRNHVLSIIAFKSDLRAEDLVNYSKDDDLKLDDYNVLFLNNISYKLFNKLINNGLTKKSVIKLIKINKNSLDKIEYNSDKFNLLPYMKLNVINKLDLYTLNYLIKKEDNIKKVFNGLNFEDYFDLYIKIIKHFNKQNYPFSYYSLLDLEQFRIDFNISKYLEINSDLMNNVIKNIEDNISMYSEEKLLFKKIPIMFSCKNTEEILNAFIDCGLDTNNMNNFDGTVFCYPSKYVLKVISIMNDKDTDVIINNKLNSNLLRYVSQMMQKDSNKNYLPMIIYRNSLNNMKL